jgi:hypothetical protein
MGDDGRIMKVVDPKNKTPGLRRGLQGVERIADAGYRNHTTGQIKA